MELSLNISGESISAEGKVIFMPKSSSEYVFLHGSESFVIRDDSGFWDTFLGRRCFCVLRGSGESVGRFRLHGLRKLEFELNLDSGRVAATLPLMGRWRKPIREFAVGQTSHAHQGNTMMLSYPACLDVADMLLGCFLLFILSREKADDSGAGDVD